MVTHWIHSNILNGPVMRLLQEAKSSRCWTFRKGPNAHVSMLVTEHQGLTIRRKCADRH